MRLKKDKQYVAIHKSTGNLTIVYITGKKPLERYYIGLCEDVFEDSTPFGFYGYQILGEL